MEIEDIQNKSMDIAALISHLQQEKLFVDTERSNLELLNEELVDHTSKLIKAAWINAQQRINLNSLVARPDYTPEQCYRRSVALAKCSFVQAKELYDYQTLSNFSQFISLLRNRTEQLAQWIVIGERLSKDTQLFCQILQTIIAGLYGSLLLPEDISMLLNLLRYLARFQLVTTDNPRRKLSQGSCAFSKMYLLFHESLPSAKLFLIAALHYPIIQLIANTSECFDIDPDKTIERLSILERFEKFGPQGTSEYEARLSEFRKYIQDQLTSFTHLFMCSIQENINCFPSTLASLIKHIIQMITQSFGEQSKEVNEISTDLIFTLYICPAIVNPEPYGICDAPISTAARHNLIQVSQLLQQLALMRTIPTSTCNNQRGNEEGCNDIASATPPQGTEDASGGDGCDTVIQLSPMHRLLQQRCDSRAYGTMIADVVEVLLATGESVNDMDKGEQQLPGVPGVLREYIVTTDYELNNLVSFLIKAHNTTLEDLGGVNETASSASDMHQQQNPKTSTTNSSFGGISNIYDADDQLLVLLMKLPSSESGGSGGSDGSGSPSRSSGTNLQLPNGAEENHSGDRVVQGGNSSRGGGGGRRQLLMNKVTGNKTSHHQQQHHHLRTSSSSDSTSDEPMQPLTALLIPLRMDRQLIGLLPENKVLTMPTNGNNNSHEISQETTSLDNLISDAIGNISNGSSDGTLLNINEVDRTTIPSSGQEKRTRFGATGDEGSIGNTSDNLEAISEAASNHSVASSMELEDHDDDDDDDDDDIVDGQNDGDNLSDMISANVSGRGSPNISGRDTPSSQVTENEDRGGGGIGGIEMGVNPGEVRPVYIASNQQHVMNVKHSILRHSDIDDKFCKFEIKQQLLPATADEAVSIISDTWSTDVLASDSETVDVSADGTVSIGHPMRHFSPIVEQPSALQASVATTGLLDVSETQSESAWSTDVLVASDTERLTEVDNDDIASVAPSDDTASVAPSEPDDGSLFQQQLNDRKLSTASTNNYSTISGYEYAHQLEHVSDRPSAVSTNHENETVVIIGRRESAPPQSFLQQKHTEEDNADGSQSTHMISDDAQLCMKDKIEKSVQRKEGSGVSTSNILRHSSRSCTDMTSTSPLSSSNRREAVLIEVGSSAEVNINAESGTTTTKTIFQRHTHTHTHITDSTNSHKLPSLPLIPIAPDMPATGSVADASCLLSRSNKLDTSGTRSTNASAYLLVKNISAQKYEAAVDSQLSNTSLNSSSSGSSSGVSEHQSKGILFPSTSANHGKWKQKWNDNLSIHGTLIESVPSTNSSINTSKNAVSGGIGTGSGKKVLANGSAVSVNGNYNRCGNSKPTAATGAIPKSISFDMSAEKGDKDSCDEQKTRRSGTSGSIFGKLKINLRSRRGKHSGVVRDEFSTSSGDCCRTFTEHVVLPSQNSSEISEDILAKYRRNNSNTSYPKKSGSVLSSDNLKPSKILELDGNDNQLILIESGLNSIHCAFEDAKKKLRIILSHSKSHNFINDGRRSVKKDLETFLQLEMAKAKHFKQWSTAARISETIRCIKLLDSANFYKLCDILQSDYRNRKVYTQYLFNSRQILLYSHSYLDELSEQVERESELCGLFLVSICVRLYLDRQNHAIQEFTSDFKRLTLVDEKHDLLSMFLKDLYSQMHKDSIWQDATSSQIEQTQIAIERSVMTEVYLYALHPNGDVDRERDRMLNEHLAKLGHTITPDHKDLQIGPDFRREAPWSPAQEALCSLAAYRAARDKVRCVTRCAAAIMSLLSLGQCRGSTAADDFVPVLVYVIIKANPRDLLSTIQYVKSFYGSQLRGEEEYWWTQFCSAVEFTKTMEYSD